MSAPLSVEEATILLARLHSEIEFDTRGHKYKVAGLGPIPSVTTVLRCLAKGDALLGWAAKMQQEADAEAFQRFLDKGGDLTAVLGSVAHAWRKRRTAEADYGKEAHALIEHHCRRMLGMDSKPPTTSDRAEAIFGRWEEWAQGVGLQPVAIEQRVYSRKYLFSGTADLIGTTKLSPRLTVFDWKGGDRQGIYPEARLQNIAYRGALKDHGLDTDGMVVRLPKVGPDWNVEPVTVPWDDLSWRAFRALRAVYDWQQAEAS